MGLIGIWGLMAIPLVITIVLLLFWPKRVKWWEILIMFVVAAVAIQVGQITARSFAVSDTEWWGFNGVKASYEEPFEYWTTCTETYACGTYSCGTSKSPRTCTQYCTRTYPCTTWAGDIGRLTNQFGESRRISKGKYNELAKRWGNNKFVDMQRHKSYKIETDGDLWRSEWDKDWKTSEPIVDKHTYENKAQCSSTIRFRKVDEKTKKKYGLIDYPDGGGWGYEMVSVLDNNGRWWALGDKKFRYLNGILGPIKRVRLWVMIFNGQPRDAAHWQRDYLKGGNKNEVIICIGVDKARNVTWAEVISWTEKKAVHVEVRNHIEANMKTLSDKTLVELGDYVEELIRKRYIKPDFKKKFAHLSVQPSTTSMVVIGIIILLINIGVAVFVVMNQFHDEPGRRQTYGRRSRRRFR